LTQVGHYEGMLIACNLAKDQLTIMVHQAKRAHTP
jgi:hypothetical protein